jgi:hypothetical protein
MTMPHCPDQANRHGAALGFSECLMACSAALPGDDFTSHGPAVIQSASAEYSHVSRLIGIQPDIVTPPPRRS